MNFKIIASILIPIFLLASFIHISAFDYNFYLSGFEKNNVYDSIPKELVDSESLSLKQYLQGRADLSSDFFNDKEKAHLVDVKNLLALNTIVAISLGLILAIYFFSKRKNTSEIFSTLRLGGYITLGVLGVLALFVIFDFGSFFVKFHEILFTNDLWLLDPRTDNLIVLFPTQFFIDITQRILLSTFLASVFIIIISSVKPNA